MSKVVNKGLYSRIKELEVVSILKEVDYKLSILIPDGTFRVHRKGMLRQGLVSTIETFTENYPGVKTFKEYSEQYPCSCKDTILMLIKANVDFNVHI